MNILNELGLKFWQGKITLWKSYWIVGELLNAIILFIIFNIELKIFNNTNLFYYIQLQNTNFPILNFKDLALITKLLIIITTIYVTVGIWRSAEKYNGKLIWIILTLIFLSYRLFTMKEIIY